MAAEPKRWISVTAPPWPDPRSSPDRGREPDREARRIDVACLGFHHGQGGMLLQQFRFLWAGLTRPQIGVLPEVFGDPERTIEHPLGRGKAPMLPEVGKPLERMERASDSQGVAIGQEQDLVQMHGLALVYSQGCCDGAACRDLLRRDRQQIGSVTLALDLLEQTIAPVYRVLERRAVTDEDAAALGDLHAPLGRQGTEGATNRMSPRSELHAQLGFGRQFLSGHVGARCDPVCEQVSDLRPGHRLGLHRPGSLSNPRLTPPGQKAPRARAVQPRAAHPRRVIAPSRIGDALWHLVATRSPS